MDCCVKLGIVELSEHFARICRFLYRDATILSAVGEESGHREAQEFWGGVLSLSGLPQASNLSRPHRKLSTLVVALCAGRHGISRSR